MDKKDFYIFLDIDGTLYDWDYEIPLMEAGIIPKGTITHFKPESMKALNYLIRELNKDYNTNLVISATMRSRMKNTIQLLLDNGLEYDGEYYKTPIFDNPINRGKEINKFLEDKQNYDYVVIDDESFDFASELDTNKIIKTEMYHNALSMDMVKNFIENMELSQ